MNFSPALPFITVGVGRLGWGLLPCLAVLCMHRDYDHEGYITVPSKGNQKLGVGGDRVAWVWVAAKELDVGAHLSNTSRITSLLFLSPPSKMCRA